MLRTVGIAVGMTTAFGVASAWAADHREAPRISEFPPADLADIYAFQAPDDADRLVLMMTVNPFSVPEAAASYAFSPRVLYQFWIDNDGDAIQDHLINIVFSELQAGAQTFTAIFRPSGFTIEGDATRPTVLSAQPNDPVIVQNGDVTMFAGPRDDPFFFDGVGFQRFVNGAGTFSGDDSFADHNVSAIVIEFPSDMVDDGDGLLQIAGVTTRRQASSYPPDDRRLDRTGIPALSTALIPSSQRNAFNEGVFISDANNFADTIVASLQNFGTSDENIATLAAVAIPDTLKLDVTQPAQFPNGRALEDDVIDTLLTLVLNGPMGDGVDSNDKDFQDSFPYLAPPFQAP